MLPSEIVYANPILPLGGLPFSPKDKILDHFSGVLPYTVVKHSLPLEERLRAAHNFAEHSTYPVIVKPNIGHRGVDLHLADNQKELDAIIENQTWDYMLQEYCDDPEEFGIFYCRIPGDTKGGIISLTQKIIPILTGDGSSTIDELIDMGGHGNRNALKEALSSRLREVPAHDETVRTLVGASHARGSTFINAENLISAELIDATNGICSVDGFYFGRLDVKSESVEELLAGEFKIIEINGATSEKIHIYDENVSFIEGLRDLMEQWTLLFQIAAACKRRRPWNSKTNIDSGASGLRSLVKLLRQYKSFYMATKLATGKLW